jgi:hypothetical protein
MDVGEWSVSGSGRFISDIPCTELLMSLGVTTLQITNYWKRFKVTISETKESERKNCLTSWKAINNNTILYFGVQINIMIFYYRLKTQNILISNLKKFKILATCFGYKKPSSGQNRTKSRYNEGVHCMGTHIVCSYWYFKNIYWLILNYRIKNE